MSKIRYEMIDSIRGLALVSMILYHACWDLVFLFGKNWKWYTGIEGYIWQQSICWTFIFLSGFCWPLGKHPVKRGTVIFAAGAAVSLVTVIFMPENRVIFGILTMVGSCMILVRILYKMLDKIPARLGFLGAVFFFLITRNVNAGYLGFESFNLIRLPEFLYRNGIMTFLGFPGRGFFSTDYFSLFPWLFLFTAGFFLNRMLSKEGGVLPKWCEGKGFLPLIFLGRHSLIFYMLHQPFLYGIFMGLSCAKLI